MDFAAISLLAVVVVFAVGAIKKNPIHLGILAMAVAYLIGKFAGVKDTAIMGYFPTTMFVRVFGIMFSSPSHSLTAQLNCWQKR